MLQALDRYRPVSDAHTTLFTSHKKLFYQLMSCLVAWVNYTLLDPANKYQSAQVKVYQEHQPVQTVAINTVDRQLMALIMKCYTAW